MIIDLCGFSAVERQYLDALAVLRTMRRTVDPDPAWVAQVQAEYDAACDALRVENERRKQGGAA